MPHYWITGGNRQDRDRAAAALPLPAPLSPAADAHRRLRGPYTAAGSLLRALVPEVLDRDPGLVQRYDIELLSAAPELAAAIPDSRQTLTTMAIPAERTRYYARLRTRRIANGLVEFLLGALPPAPRSLIVQNADEADLTDLEFLAAALRRIDPARLTLVVCAATSDVPDDTLRKVLADRADHIPVTTPAKTAPANQAAAANQAKQAAAWAYVQAECTSDDPALIAAYQALAPADRASLHDRRAAELAARDEPSLRNGAIPYHREHGTDPSGAGARARHAAQDYCVRMGFYQAGAEHGFRGLALVDPATQPGVWWDMAAALGLGLSVLSRTHEALDLYDQARLNSTDPDVHMAAAYATAMVYTRHNDPAERDEAKAKAWLNAAIATASLIADPIERAFHGAFYRNGLALVEVNLGEPAVALRLVNECIESLDRQLKPDEHRLHRSVLKNNRGRVHAALGHLDEALADYAAAIAEDPNHAEHYLERGNILRRLGRYDEAAADYKTAIGLSPPFAEIYYNRADLRLSLGDRAGALADFGYVLELDPALVDAYVNRAGLYLDDGEVAAARLDALAGLEHDPGNAYLHAILGRVHEAAGDAPAALAAYDRAVETDPEVQAAWVGRAEVLFEAGRHEAALTSLDRALELSEDAAILFNRAMVRHAAGQPDRALADLERARQLDPADPDIADQLDRCRTARPVPLLPG